MFRLRWLVLWLGLGVACAQETVNQASVGGVVRDKTGAVIAGASVEAVDVETNVSHKVVADGLGRFRLPYLPVGPYCVYARSAGFAESMQHVELTAGTAFDLPFALGAGENATVDVVQTPLVDTERSEVSSTVRAEEVEQLPFLGRNFLDLVLLAPGVSATNTAATQLFAETSAVAGQGISVNSQRNFSNSFILDGLSANDDAAGLVETSFALEAIQELQVVTSGGQAEYGRALGGYLNFVSRSGTNALHGNAYGYLRNQRLNAANALSGTTLPLTQAQYGASLGGPIQRDKTFYFGNFEQKQLNQNGVLTIGAANGAAIDAVLAAKGYAGPLLAIAPSGATIYPNPVKSSNFFAKVDHRAGAQDDLSVRYSLYHVTSVNSRGVGGLSYTSAAAGLADLDQTIAVGNVFTLTPRTVNETRGQFTRSNLAAPVNDPEGPAVSISGVATFGTLSASPTGRFDRLYEVVDNLSHQAGAHALRLGVDAVANDLTITFPMASRGSYAFSSPANFQAGRYTTFTQAFGNPVVPQTNAEVGIYAQDSWRVGDRLTLNYGVRYDLDFLKSVATDTDNVSPRFGLDWAPYADRRTVVRASYGLFYDRVPLRALSNALESDGNSTVLGPQTFTTLALNFGQAGAPVFPAIVQGYTAATIPANLRISLTTFDPHLPVAYSQQASAEVEQQMSATSTLAISYQHVRGEHLLASVNENVPSCTAAVDPVNLCRPVSAYANNKQYRGAGDSYYDGLAVSYVQRPVKYGSYRVSYAWSKAIDDVGEFFFSAPVNNFDVGEDRGRSDDDQRHRVSFDATAHTAMDRHRVLGGIQMSGILQYTSRLPFNVVTGTNSVQTTGLRPCVLPVGNPLCGSGLPGTMIGRNAGRGFDFFNLNARLTKTFWFGDRVKLEGIAEGFNVLNHRNDMVPVGTFGTGTYPGAPAGSFGQATAVGDPRQVQFALRVSF